MIHPLTDEILERLFYACEEGRGGLTVSELPGNGDVEAALRELGALVTRTADRISLTPGGEVRARGIVRRHRLAEILFTQILDVPMREAERSACEFEHILAESVVDRVCTFLGHPPQCPHGHPIPQGSCCRIYSKKVEPLITRLIDLPLGSTGSVAFITPKSVSRLNRLASFGVVPGTTIRLIERKPSVVFSCGHTSIAVEDEIGREIYVRPILPSSSPTAANTRDPRNTKLSTSSPVAPVRGMPKAFVTLGDSVCAFNPVYGLGMTLTGLEVEELQRCLRESDGGRTLDPLAFQKAVGKLVTAPWALTTGEDLRWPATQGGEITPKVKLMHWYIDQIMRLIPNSPEVFTRFQMVNHMLAGPETLFHPAVSGRVLRQALTPDWRRFLPFLGRQKKAAPATEPKPSTVTLQTRVR